jgi:rod shape-determining protein MreD
VKATSVVVTMIIAVAVQVVLARYAAGGRWLFDLVLVAVVYAALSWGPIAGILAGTVGGLLQDMLSGGIIGVGGLAKTLVGFAAGTVGAQFIVTRLRERLLVVAAASVAHRLVILAVYGLIDQRWPIFPWAAMLSETVVNGAFALVVFQAVEGLPGALSQGRMSRRSRWGRRRW